MNPGFMSLWIMLIMIILLATGWKPYLAPDLSRPAMTLFGIVMLALLPVSAWWSPMRESMHVGIHVSVCFLLLAGLLAFWGEEQWSYKSYLALCAIMIAVIWGFVRKIYSYDPVFYWLGPVWDAPLLAGVLCGAFSSSAKHQFGMLIWGAVLGEWLNTLLQARGYTAWIGTLSWWDGFWIAVATARLFAFALKLLRAALSKLGILFWHMKGGRSS
ncbi:YphA family membrane protein [Paenibacillus arenilitoris]|uniref:Uncharacterized protein n=1 Tax=Paenibacillus arenilitoris TaxID=2772299 RepID=A0A927CPN2_9BACL|nr:hypothetical protein [Paenibacillus arenilitoris]MBD2869636.1 hypothetical protein [Paenibacillus arenilitoris]